MSEQNEATAPEPRMVDIDSVNVLGLAELAQRWGISKQRVDEVVTKRLPPWKRLSCGRLWLEPDIRRFEATWTRRTGVHIGKEED